MRIFWQRMALSGAVSLSYCIALGLFSPGWPPWVRITVIALGSAAISAQLLLLLYVWRQRKRGRAREAMAPMLIAVLSVYMSAASLLFFVTRHWPFGARAALTVVASLLPPAIALLSLHRKGRTGK